MNSTMITSSDILEQRNKARRAALLAHTPNGIGEFTARLNCTCYTCRDLLDPTGEEDAVTANIALHPHRLPTLKLSIPQPSTTSSTCQNSPHPPPPSETHRPVCCQRSPLLLPIPPRAHRLPTRSESDSSDLLSPCALPERPDSPTNLSFKFTIQLRPLPNRTYSADKTKHDSKSLESNLLPKMEQLLEAYQAELLEIEGNYEKQTLRMEEMAAIDQLWNELDRKIDALHKAVKQIKRVV